MTEHIIKTVAVLPKVCEHFNIPLQAGDDEVLAKMRRGYTIGEYVEWVHRIREIVPDASLSTDVIVGFCGETDAQFQNTMGVLADLRFDKVHVAAYSPRPGTIAWRHMEDTIPQEEKMRRLHAVEELQERIATEINARYTDTVQTVLVEGEKAGDEGDLIYTGRNRANKLVHFRAQSGNGPGIGDVVDVLITKTTPWSLQGRVSVAAGAPA
jgi:tRNA-2-methylthio-N6-dimethylallyladenosine synthase